ncbi:unnamed protein product [Nippostrongylus brasiliensis]|uniref:Dephospho-CoA kinase 1 (inferred by orthology to a C. elegans protein) n=1 Tax=Nippostrongylus brasiliensis TaxID=27835 RepID=A0A0N4Y1D6_NIPBR|nr:unnamed protein product [Nippostrongylus brasiliensis]
MRSVRLPHTFWKSEYNFGSFLAFTSGMVIIGLTGGIATGKSSVSEMMRSRGLHVIDADAVARKVVEPGTSAYGKLRKEFGDEFFDAGSGELNRAKMSDLVFHNIEVLKYLLLGTHYIVLDTPLLFETGYQNVLRTIIVVWCEHSKTRVYSDEATQLQRLMLRDKLNEEEALSRIAAQMPIRKKMKMATILIDNNGTKQELQLKLRQFIPNHYTSFANSYSVSIIIVWAKN